MKKDFTNILCIWDSFFLVHAPEGVFEMYICVGKFN